MRSAPVVLLLVALTSKAAWSQNFSQTLESMQLHLSELSQAQAMAVAFTQRTLLESIEKQRNLTPTASVTPPPAVVVQAIDAAKTAQDALAKAPPPPQVTEPQRHTLEAAILDFQNAAENKRIYYGRLATGFTIASLL